MNEAGDRSLNEPVPNNPATSCRPGKPKKVVACTAWA